MTMQTLTIELPDELYEQLRDRARLSKRSIEEALTDLLVDALPVESGLPVELTEALATLGLLDDDALWAAARSHLSTELAADLEDLHLQQQREGLSEQDVAREALLLRQYERALLVRAEAARLLHERGQDISSLLDR